MLLVGACNPRSSAPLVVAFADSVPYLDEMGGGALHRIAVGRGSNADTLDDVLVDVLPVLMADSAITGLGFNKDGSQRAPFIYLPDRGELRWLRTPVGLDASWNGAAWALSPNGQLFAYVRRDSLGPVGVVTTWPDQKVILTTPRGTGYPSDVSYDHIAWFERDSFRILMRLDVPGDTTDWTDGHFLRTMGSAKTARARTDTIYHDMRQGYPYSQ